jgi:predicted enzyme related to lactoylglutathione lyase
MSDRSDYVPGEFCWVDLSTSDVEAATAYYTDLLGVSAEAAPGDPEETGGYGFFSRDGKMVAGFGPLQPGSDGPSSWNSWIKVEDADAAAEKVKGAGGNVAFGPTELPNDSGRVAACTDPEGAYFGIIEQDQHPGAQIVNEVGAWTFNQLQTRDQEAAAKFYGDVFGWEFKLNEEAAADAPFWMIQIEGQKYPEGAAGAMDITGQMPDEVPAHWLVYLGVPDADQAVEKTKAAGGQEMFPPTDINIGRIAGVVDAQGAGFAVFKPDLPEPR